MENKEYVAFIDSLVKSRFPGIENTLVSYEGLINNNFQVQYLYKGVEVAFIKDRGQLELVVTRNGTDTWGHLLDRSLDGLKVNKEDILLIVDFLQSYFDGESD